MAQSALPPGYKHIDLLDPQCAEVGQDIAEQLLAVNHTADALAIAAHIMGRIAIKAMYRGKTEAETLALRDSCATLLTNLAGNTAALTYNQISLAKLADTAPVNERVF